MSFYCWSRPISTPDNYITFECTSNDAWLNKTYCKNSWKLTDLCIPKSFSEFNYQIIIACKIHFTFTSNNYIFVDFIKFDIKNLVPRTFATGHKKVFLTSLSSRIKGFIYIINNNAMIIIHASGCYFFSIIWESYISYTLFENTTINCFRYRTYFP